MTPHVGFDDFFGFLSVSDMHSERRDPFFFPEIVYSEARTDWMRNMGFNKCFVHATRGGSLENVEEVTIPVLSQLDDRWCAYSTAFIRRMAASGQPWFLYHNTRGAHFDNYPLQRYLGASPARHPYKDTMVELDDIVGRLVEALEDTGQLEHTLIFLSSDNGPHLENWPDAAYTPFRCAKGSTDRYLDGVDQTSFLLAADRLSCRKYHYYWLVDTFSALRVGEYKWVLTSTSDDDADVHAPGGFTGVTQRYTYPRLYNLYLDPKESRSYLTRKLAYLEVLREGRILPSGSWGWGRTDEEDRRARPACSGLAPVTRRAPCQPPPVPSSRPRALASASVSIRWTAARSDSTCSARSTRAAQSRNFTVSSASVRGFVGCPLATCTRRRSCRPSRSVMVTSLKRVGRHSRVVCSGWMTMRTRGISACTSGRRTRSSVNWAKPTVRSSSATDTV